MCFTLHLSVCLSNASQEAAGPVLGILISACYSVKAVFSTDSNLVIFLAGDMTSLVRIQSLELCVLVLSFRFMR